MRCDQSHLMELSDPCRRPSSSWSAACILRIRCPVGAEPCMMAVTCCWPPASYGIEPPKQYVPEAMVAEGGRDKRCAQKAGVAVLDGTHSVSDAISKLRHCDMVVNRAISHTRHLSAHVLFLLSSSRVPLPTSLPCSAPSAILRSPLHHGQVLSLFEVSK